MCNFIFKVNFTFPHASDLPMKMESKIHIDESQQVFVVGFGRTPIGSFQGALSKLTAVNLMSECIESVFEKSKLSTSKPKVTELVIGNVCQSGLKQAPANQIARRSGLPTETNCHMISKVCSSGMMAVIQASKSILLGDAEVIIC